MTIINLTQHTITPEQLAQGVRDLPDWSRPGVKSLLTLNEPDARMGRRAAALLAKLCQDVALEVGATEVMIAPGAIPMFVLAEAIADVGLRVVDSTGEDITPWEK